METDFFISDLYDHISRANVKCENIEACLYRILTLHIRAAQPLETG